jgi:hypothetical protein
MRLLRLGGAALPMAAPTAGGKPASAPPLPVNSNFSTAAGDGFHFRASVD